MRPGAMRWQCQVYRYAVSAFVRRVVRLAPINPFVVVVLAQLEANANHPDALRLIRKEALVRRLYDWGFSRNQIVSLFNILDATLAPILFS